MDAITDTRLDELRRKHYNVALELDILSGYVNPETGEKNLDHKKDEVQDFMELCVLEVMDTIYEQGHSGFSHGYLVNVLIPLLKDLTPTPLTGHDWEWKHVYGNVYQNRRCPQVFKEGANGTAYNVEGYAFSDDGGDTYYTSRDSRKYISFPCSWRELETEYIVKESGDENDQT